MLLHATHARVLHRLWLWVWCAILCKAIVVLALVPAAFEPGQSGAEISSEQPAFAERRTKESDIRPRKVATIAESCSVQINSQEHAGDPIRGARRRLANGWVVPLRC